MRQQPQQSLCFIVSVILHTGILIFLVFGFAFSSPIAVIQNTNKFDTISAVVLGESEQSKILPQPTPPPLPQPQPVQKELAPVKPKDVAQEEDAIALKAAKKKQDDLLKAEQEKKKRERLAKDLLADIQKESVKQKQLQQKKLRQQFEKTLQEQAEKTLRQAMITEDIALKSKKSREAQGEVNKYKALIVQAISENWLVPPSADKKLYCQLMIRIAASGEVLDVHIIKSSGDKALDSSARAAVLKASPLPVPKDKEAFQSFKEFVLKVKPENIIQNDSLVSAT